MQRDFSALEYTPEGGFREARFSFKGSPADGWTVLREERQALRLGPGYRLLRSVACGVCSTDLARRFLPFPLPQITGHEVFARDDGGARFAVEINASHRVRGLDVSGCPFCAGGLDRHCPDRLVLGIHDLPGGFGPWLLAPVGAAVAVPAAIPDDAVPFIEPLAAALNAVDAVAPRRGERIAVLGPRKLGMLVIAALAASGTGCEITALSRRPELRDLARDLGATAAAESGEDGAFDVVVDTTGDPAGLAEAIRMARREVHLKSTHGRPACGLRHLTELVVDELNLGAAEEGEATTAKNALGRVDAMVVDSAEGIDRAIRPSETGQESAVSPRGEIRLRRDASGDSPLVRAVADRGLRLSSSRCGDFHRAIAMMLEHGPLRTLPRRLVTHVFAAGDLPAAFEAAASKKCVKAVVRH